MASDSVIEPTSEIIATVLNVDDFGTCRSSPVAVWISVAPAASTTEFSTMEATTRS